MKLPPAVWGAAALCLTGCTSGQIGALPAATPAAEASVHVMRQSTFMDALGTFRIAYDKQNLFDIGNGDVGTFQVPAGPHDIVVKCFGGLLPIVHTDDVQQNFVAGRDYYFVVAPDVVNCATIADAGIVDGKAMMYGLTPIELGNK